jgi:hypothetical protein
MGASVMDGRGVSMAVTGIMALKRSLFEVVASIIEISHDLEERFV